ncbi:hypothetical protein HK096_010743, partial [Nowakowskiella sp. JEL0078]
MFADGRYSKKSSNEPFDANAKPKRRVDSKKMEACQEMIKNILSLFKVLLSHSLFTDIPLAQLRVRKDPQPPPLIQSPRPSTTNNRPPLQTKLSALLLVPPPLSRSESASSMVCAVPPLQHIPPIPIVLGSFLSGNPLTASHFGTKIASEVMRCLTAVKNMRVGGGGSLGTEELLFEIVTEIVDGVRGRVAASICDGMVYESKFFYKFENWTFEPDVSSTSQLEVKSNRHTETTLRSGSIPFVIASETTALPKLFYRFIKNILRCLHQIIGPIKPKEQPDQLGGSVKRQSLAFVSVEASSGKIQFDRVKAAFFEAMYMFLDGLQWLAVHWKPDSSGFRALVDGGDGYLKKLDVSKMDTRVLVVVANIKVIRELLAPKLVSLFEDKFGNYIQTETP